MSIERHPFARRHLLSGAAALSALALPSLADAAALQDTTLIAKADLALALALKSNAVLKRRCDLDGEVERLMPIKARPEAPASVKDAEITVERGAHGAYVIHNVPIAPDPDAVLAAAQQDAAIRDWEDEREAIAERVGLHDASDLHDDLYERLEAAVIELTPITPATLAGLVAKARVALELDPADDFSLNDWEHELRAAVLRDLVALSGRSLTT